MKWVHWILKNDTIRCQNGKEINIVYLFWFGNEEKYANFFLTRERETKLNIFFELYKMCHGSLRNQNNDLLDWWGLINWPCGCEIFGEKYRILRMERGTCMTWRVPHVTESAPLILWVTATKSHCWSGW